MNEERRTAIVWLLEHRNDHLPMPVRHVETTPGFLNEPRARTCPDCLANGRTMPGCETCGGSGVVAPARLGLVAVTDELPDDGIASDPYQSKKILPYGFDATRHDQAVERDVQIARLEQQTRPPQSEATLLAEANARGYAWEEERKAMYRRYDFAPLDRALDILRAYRANEAHALNAVYVDGWMVEVGIITPAIEQLCEQGLGLLDVMLPEHLRSGAANRAAERIARKQQQQAA